MNRIISKVMNYRKLIFVSSIVAAFFASACLNGDEPITPQQQLEIDKKAIDDFLASKSITAVKDTTGLRYVVHDPGDDAAPTPQLSDSVTVNYKLKSFPAETQIEKGDTVTFKLNRLIVGWQIGIPKIKEGGSITLYVPSGYAYGTGNLIFDIDLIDVK